jgi:hypothetical protein
MNLQVHTPRPPTAMRRTMRELRLVQRLLEEHRAAAVWRYGAAALEAIDLPPLGSTAELDPAQVRAAGALLWAREVEAAGLPSFVDALAEGLLEGKVLLDVGAAADRLMLYWRSRDTRFSAQERAAIYQRAFDQDFEAAFSKLLQSLDAIARAPYHQNLEALHARAAEAAREVGDYLSQHSGGIALYAAKSISDQVREALAILRDPTLATALGGGSPWQMMRVHAIEILGRPLDPEPHLDRASAALRLTDWIAAAAQGLSSGAGRPTHDAIDAAELWLAAGEGP